MGRKLIFNPLGYGFKEPSGIKVYVIDKGDWVVIKWFCDHSEDRYDLDADGVQLFYDKMLEALKRWRGGLAIISVPTDIESVNESRKTIWPALVVLETFQKLTRLLESRSHETYRQPGAFPRQS